MEFEPATMSDGYNRSMKYVSRYNKVIYCYINRSVCYCEQHSSDIAVIWTLRYESQ